MQTENMLEIHLFLILIQYQFLNSSHADPPECGPQPWRRRSAPQRSEVAVPCRLLAHPPPSSIHWNFTSRDGASRPVQEVGISNYLLYKKERKILFGQKLAQARMVYTLGLCLFIFIIYLF